MVACSVCRLPSDLRAELQGMVARNVPLRTIEARFASAGHTARKDAIARHVKNGHLVEEDDGTELRAMAFALRRVLPTAPGVAAALAQEVEMEGAADLGRALRDLIPNGTRVGGSVSPSDPGCLSRKEPS